MAAWQKAVRLRKRFAHWWRHHRPMGPSSFGFFPYVNVYEVAQLYGGPEEGGWWYWAGAACSSRRVPWFLARFVCKRVAAQLKREPEGDGSGWWFPAWDGIGDPDAGGMYDHGRRATIEDHPAEDYPKERPYYE